MKNKQEIVNQLESLKPNETFIIRYYATKHKKIIERLGITFWDSLRNRYTTATNYILNIIGEVENE